jgi:hypothetical protein
MTHWPFFAKSVEQLPGGSFQLRGNMLGFRSVAYFALLMGLSIVARSTTPLSTRVALTIFLTALVVGVCHVIWPPQRIVRFDVEQRRIVVSLRTFVFTTQTWSLKFDEVHAVRLADSTPTRGSFEKLPKALMVEGKEELWFVMLIKPGLATTHLENELNRVLKQARPFAAQGVAV